MSEKLTTPTYVPDPKVLPSPEQAQQVTIRPGSRLAILGVFVEMIRRRFVPPNVPSDFQWVWNKDPNKSTLLIESAFAEDVTAKNVKPSIYVDVDDQTVGRTVLGDLAGQNLQLGKRGFWHLVTVPILIECTAAKRGESAILADITGIFVQASSRLTQAKFAFHDMTPVVIGRTQPSTSDKNRHVTPVTLNVQHVLRYAETETKPLLADLEMEIEQSGEDGTNFLEQVSLGLRR